MPRHSAVPVSTSSGYSMLSNPAVERAALTGATLGAASYLMPATVEGGEGVKKRSLKKSLMTAGVMGVASYASDSMGWQHAEVVSKVADAVPMSIVSQAEARRALATGVSYAALQALLYKGDRKGKRALLNAFLGAGASVVSTRFVEPQLSGIIDSGVSGVVQVPATNGTVTEPGFSGH